MPASHRFNLTRGHQVVDLSRHDFGVASAVDHDQFDPSATDAVLGVQLLGSQLTAGKAGGTVNARRPLKRGDEGNGQSVGHMDLRKRCGLRPKTPEFPAWRISVGFNSSEWQRLWPMRHERNAHVTRERSEDR